MFKMTYTTQTNKQLHQTSFPQPTIQPQPLPLPQQQQFFGKMFERVKVTNPKCMSCHGAV